MEDDEGIGQSISSGPGSSAGGHTMANADFFSPEVFQIVLRNPTTAYRFLKFCQSRNCGEALEFLQKVSK